MLTLPELRKALVLIPSDIPIKNIIYIKYDNLKNIIMGEVWRQN